MAWFRRGATWTWRWAGTRWLLLAVAVAACAGWALDLRPVAVVWGPVGTWVGGLATAGGLVFTGVQLRDARRDRREEVDRRRQDEAERREAMARSVSVDTVVHRIGDEWVVDYTIVNGGDFPIENVVLLVADVDAVDVRPADGVGTCLQLVVGTLHHKEIVRDDHGPLRIKREPASGELTALGSLRFTDTWGQSWWRGPGRLERTADPARG